MKDGVSLETENDKYLQMAIVPAQVKDKLTAKSLLQLVKSEYADWAISESDIAELAKQFQSADPKSDTPLTSNVAEAMDFQVSFKLSEDKLSADLKLTAPQGGKAATTKAIVKACKKNNIVRGISTKNIAALIEKVTSAGPGSQSEALIARGLPARNGKKSKSVPLFDNVIDQIRSPKLGKDGKADMRDFGVISAVKVGQPVLRFKPPGKGRKGYTVTGQSIPAKEGEWQSKKIGKGTAISKDDHRLVLAEMEGIPKIENGVVTVEDTFTSKGCNVKTGNIVYEGNAIINGDVADGMKIEVKGDIVVNGFVESATLVAGGDITITEGATGKMNDDLSESNTLIKAKGDVHLKQGRGLMINANGKVTVTKQLAFSNVDCMGDVIAGVGKVPDGSIYASDIKACGKVRVGKLGAVSGSKVFVSFGTGFTRLKTNKERFLKIQENLQASLVKHRKTLELSQDRELSEEKQNKINKFKKLYKHQERSLEAVEKKLKETEELLETFESIIGVETYQKLFHGVNISYDKYAWDATDDKNRAKVTFKGGRWNYEPMI